MADGNHPNRARYLTWLVHVGATGRARFSDYGMAHWFAKHYSAAKGCDAEVSGRGAIYGQYVGGVSTPEFAQHAADAAAGWDGRMPR